MSAECLADWTTDKARLQSVHHARKRDLGLAARYKGAAAAPSLHGLRLFCFYEHACARMAPFYGGLCGDTRKGVPVPLSGPPTLHGPSPLLGGLGDGLKPRHKGACHGWHLYWFVCTRYISSP